MKKGILLTLLMLCVLAFAGCGAESPTTVANHFMGAIKAKDAEAIGKYYAGDADDVNLGEVAEEDLSEEGATSDELKAVFEEKLYAFDYSVDNEAIDGDKATVEVTVQAYPMGDAMTNVLSRMFEEMFAMLFDTNTTEDDLDNLTNKMMVEEFNKLTEKSYNSTVTLHLEKVDDEWKVSDIQKNKDNYKLLNAMSGGLLTFAEDIAESWGGLLDDSDDGNTDSYDWLWDDATDDDAEDDTDDADDTDDSVAA